MKYEEMTPASKALARRCVAEEVAYNKYVSACLELGNDIMCMDAYETVGQLLELARK